MIPFLEDFH